MKRIYCLVFIICSVILVIYGLLLYIFDNKLCKGFLKMVTESRGKKLHYMIWNYLSKVNIREDKTYNIMDFGCGLGYLSSVLKVKHNVLSVDILDKTIYDNLNLQLIKPIDPSTNTILPYKDKQFDITVVSYCIHHISKKDQLFVLNEIIRCSKIVLLMEEDPVMELWCRISNGEVFTHNHLKFSMI